MLPEPVALALYAPRFFLLQQEEAGESASRESAAAQTPSRPVDATRTREREASIPPWVFLLLIPVFLALVALIFLRQRGYNPHRRLDLRKQPEGARYRERVAPTHSTDPALDSAEPEAAPDDESDFAPPPAPRFREEENSEDPDVAVGELVSDAEDDSWSLDEDSGSASELFREESGELAIEEFSAATERPEMDFSRDEVPSLEERESREPAIATAIAAQSDEIERLKAERLEGQQERQALHASLSQLKDSHAAELAVGDEKRALLQSELELSEGRLAEERQQRERLQSELETLKSELSSLREQAQRDSEESRRLSQSLAATRVECDDLRQKLDAMDEDLQYRDEKCGQLSEQTRLAEESCQRLQREMQAVHEALAGSKAKLDEQERLAAESGGLSYAELLAKLNEKRKLVQLLQAKLREKLVEIARMTKREKTRTDSAPGGH